MLIAGWLFILGANAKIGVAILTGLGKGAAYYLLAAIALGSSGLLLLPPLSLNAKSLLGLTFMTAVSMLAIFGPAKTFDYWQGWLYLAVYVACSLLTTLYLMKYDPALLQRRLRSGPLAEPKVSQRIIMLFVSIGYFALLVVPALDHRWGWSDVPAAVSILGAALLAAGLGVVFLVYRQNTYTAATVRVESGQHVTSSGPYGIVRHPMYAGMLLMFFGTPLALGSYWALPVTAAIVPFLVWRLLDEEKLLARDLPGYADYQKRVRWRLAPGLF
jgi:protein-S-isoprenylcysteine O-methyltransferase Ste14